MGVDADPIVAPSSPTPHHRHRARRWIIVGIIGTVVLVLVVPLAFGVLLWTRLDRLSAQMTGSARGGTTYLLVGSDSRADITGAKDKRSFGDTKKAPGDHADMILLLRVPDDGSTARLLSVPRDLLVLDEHHRPDRLGLVYDGGPQQLVNTLCDGLGIGVDHVMVLHFLSFQGVVDAVGGVDVSVARRSRDRVVGLHLVAGHNHLGPKRALAFARARHIEEWRDGKWVPQRAGAITRQTHARAVLTQVGQRTPGLSDPIGFARVAWAVSGAVQVDDSMGIGDFRGLERALHGISTARDLVLPVSYVDGPVPVATLRNGASSVLARFSGSPVRGRCSNPQISAARAS